MVASGSHWQPVDLSLLMRWRVQGGIANNQYGVDVSKSEDGILNDNLAWKDSVLVPTGKTIEILVCLHTFWQIRYSWDMLKASVIRSIPY